MVDLGPLRAPDQYFRCKTAVLYVPGLVVAILGGTLIEKMHMEPQIESFVLRAGNVDIESTQQRGTA